MEPLGPAKPGAKTLVYFTYTPHWKLWLFDMMQRSAKPVEGVGVETADGAQFAVLDGRTFVFLPYNDWGRTKGYELLPNGTAIERFDTVGDVFKWVRVR